MLKIMPQQELDAIKEDIKNNRNITHYIFHPHPDVRAIIARTEHAPQAYIIDESPEVRLGLIETGKWLDRIAPNEKNTNLIIAIIKQGQKQRRWFKSDNKSIRLALDLKSTLG